MRKGSHICIIRLLVALFLCLGVSSMAVARSGNPEPLDSEGKRTWIIELTDPSMLRFGNHQTGQSQLESATSRASKKGGKRLDLLSPQAQAHARYLDDRFDQFYSAAKRAAGEAPVVRARYKNLLNGVALRLTEAQAQAVRELPAVKSLFPNEIHRIETDASPDLIGATQIWAGLNGLPESRGEGVVIGVVDTGINWDHPSFGNPAPDGYDHVNPFGQQLGLCSDPEVLCSDKLVGVYDFTEEGSKGKDTNFHGSHVASIAVGNRIEVTIQGVPSSMQGIAPRANLVTYKVCVEDDPDTPDEDEEGCGSAEIIQGLEQALTDGVDVVNLSLGSQGGNPASPWDVYARLFLDLRDAGIFAATSAGNGGPAAGSASNPGLAPWLLNVAAATHTRLTGALLKDLSGGNSEPPANIAGQGLDPVEGPVDGIGPVEIVWAGDYGFPLCGSGEPELLPTCNEHTGSSNPFTPGTFDGQIVVCLRGTFGRVEKGFNVRESGAGGYILINSAANGEELLPDNHCLPGIHVGYNKGQELQSWLTSGSGHMGSIGPFGLSYETSVADVLADFSSQGPNAAVPSVLTPGITAPGIDVLGAGKDDEDLMRVDGTSMASPHVAGGGALLLSLDPDLTPSQIQSILQTTATTEVINYLGHPATPFEMGTGRLQLVQAFEAGLSMDVSTAEFIAANPAIGGDPSSLNLPGMVNPACQEHCGFTREMTDRAGGASWTVSAENFPAGAVVTVTPASFTLSSGSSQALQIDLDLGPATLGRWVFGEIRLSSPGLPDQHLTAAVFSTGGNLPQRWDINDNRNSGWKDFALQNLSALPNATFSPGGLVEPSSVTQTLPQDPTDFDPFDTTTGLLTRLFSVPGGSLWFSTRTPSSTAIDLDLFVGRDANGDGVADESELLCESSSPSDIESCDIFSPEAGDYWVIVQNWKASSAPGGDEATLISAVVGPSADSPLAASGPGIVNKNDPFTVRVSWDDVNALPGEEFLGAVAVGSHSDLPGNLGVIPVHFNRNGIAAPQTFPLIEGTWQRLALAANAEHDLLFIDVPTGASSLTVAAKGADDPQNNGLMLELVRLDFDDALAVPPFAAHPGNAAVIGSASGNGANGPTVTISGSALQAGRWYAVLNNSNDTPSAIEIRADVEFSGTPIALHPGLWEPISRPNIKQGYDYNMSGPSRALIWYTYGEDGQPVWFISGTAHVQGNIWTADLLRLTNDGSEQQLARVGQMVVTLLAENDAMFTFTLYGESGTDRIIPLSALTCPEDNGSGRSHTGLWFRGLNGLGGASVLMNASAQAQIHYLYDALGMPRWLFAQDALGSTELPIWQFKGFCPVCAPEEVSWQTVGVLGTGFSSETAGSWILDYLFAAPLQGSVERTDQIVKLTDTITCD